MLKHKHHLKKEKTKQGHLHNNKEVDGAMSTQLPETITGAT
jgi:hypothetical protein